jgi:1,4-dihydroxy-2-naphthoyl-CoA synthase
MHRRFLAHALADAHRDDAELGAAAAQLAHQLAMQAMRLYYFAEESQEGVKALNEKREPDFMKYYR